MLKAMSKSLIKQQSGQKGQKGEQPTFLRERTVHRKSSTADKEQVKSTSKRLIQMHSSHLYHTLGKDYL
jgi:hypothetical protein